MCMSDHLRLVLTLLCIVTLITARQVDNHKRKIQGFMHPGTQFLSHFLKLSKTETKRGGTDCDGHASGSVYSAGDECNTCYCYNGAETCTQLECVSVGMDCNGHPSGSKYPQGDDCNTCMCNDGIEQCTFFVCGSGCNGHADGTTYPADDGCNTCFCYSGTETCTLLACGSDCNGHAEGTSYPAGDNCNTCFCHNGIEKCTILHCGGDCNGHPDGSSYPASDGCNTCYCKDGIETCTLLSCSPTPGTCPTPTAIGTCDLLCSVDGECDATEKCCSNGCGRVCMEPIPDVECPPGVPIVACFADPCSVTKCPLFPNAQCISNFCGGCNADFYVDGKPVDCTDTGVSGDPHMTTFDGRKYSFQGLCWYTLFKDCLHPNPDFEVTTMFEPRDDSSAEHVKTRTVSINITVGNEYAIVNGLDVITGKAEGHGTAAQAIYVQHEDKKTKLSFISMDTKFTLNWTVKKHILSVSFTGSAYKNKLCGLLGNADGDTRNDFQTPDGAVVRDAVEFGESWKVKEKKCD